MCEDLTHDYQTLAYCHTEEMAQLLEDFGESQEEAFRQLCDIGSEHQRAEEMKKAEAITLEDSDSTRQDENPTKQKGAPEVTTMTAPNKTLPAMVVTTKEAIQEEPRSDTCPLQPSELQTNPDHTSTCAEDEIRPEPTTEALREETLVERQIDEPNHVTAPSVDKQ